MANGEVRLIGGVPRSVDALGLPIETERAADQGGYALIFYGEPGTGKSTQVARAFPQALYVQTQLDILRAAEDWVRNRPNQWPQGPSGNESGRQLFGADSKILFPNKLTLDERSVTEVYGGWWHVAVNAIVSKFIAACTAGTNPYSALVFDEWNKICAMVYTEFQQDPYGQYKEKSGKINIFKVMTGFQLWHNQVIATGRITGRVLGLVAHAQSPRYYDSDMDRGSRNFGELKVHGGPQMPVGLNASMKELCASASIVLELAIKQEPKFSLDLSSLMGAAGAVKTEAAAGAVATAPGFSLANLGSLMKSADPAPAALIAPIGTPPAATPAASSRAPRVLHTDIKDNYFRKVRADYVTVPYEVPLTEGYGLKEFLEGLGYRCIF